jgi:predicted nucleic acid-binding protein
MAQRNAYFVDTGVWKARWDLEDQWYYTVNAILREVTGFRPQLFTTDVVVLEFITLSRSRGTSIHKIDEYVGAILDSAEVIYTLPEDLRQARVLLVKYEQISFSGFDASSFAVMRRYEINKVLSTDDEFIKCGHFIDVRPNVGERKVVLR